MKKLRKCADNQNSKVMLFSITIIFTILLCRFFIYYIFDPNPSIFGIELHHFDYGMILLGITSLFLLFGRKKTNMHFVALGISFGLIIDELWFIRKQIGGNMPELYNPSFFPAIIIALLTSLVVFMILKLGKK
jgi:hypothetical protein